MLRIWSQTSQDQPWNSITQQLRKRIWKQNLKTSTTNLWTELKLRKDNEQDFKWKREGYYLHSLGTEITKLLGSNSNYTSTMCIYLVISLKLYNSLISVFSLLYLAYISDFSVFTGISLMGRDWWFQYWLEHSSWFWCANSSLQSDGVTSFYILFIDYHSWGFL